MRLNRFMLTAWLLAPVVIVTGLWFATDREAARKDRSRFAARTAAARSGDTTPPSLPPIVVPLKDAAAPIKTPDAAPSATLPGSGEPGHQEHPASEKRPTPTQPPRDPAPPKEPTMVQPEFLSQGIVIVVKDLTGLATPERAVHISSNWNAWSTADEGSKLSLRSDLSWQIILKPGAINQPLQFKFTRGTSDSPECKPDGTTIDFRTLPRIDTSKLATPDERPVFLFEIAAWQDQHPGAGATPQFDPYFALDKAKGITGTIKRVQVAGGGIWGVRDLLVWLPTDYDKPENASRMYPVLYLHDGQHVFVKSPPATDEWGADETATKLIADGRIEPLIIVGVPCHPKYRTSEYSPVVIDSAQPPRGEQYAAWFGAEVMPRVERAFRIKQGPTNSAVGGAGLGAIISLEIAQRFPDRIGKVLLESPTSADPTGASITRFESAKAWPKIIYAGFGGRESVQPVSTSTASGTPAANASDTKPPIDFASKFQALVQARLAPTQKSDKDKADKDAKSDAPTTPTPPTSPTPPAALANDNIKFVTDEQGTFDETTWAKRFGPALEFLFPPVKDKPKKTP